MSTTVPIPLLDVQPVLSYTATCFCGWASSGWATEDEGKIATADHILHPRCATCLAPLVTCWPEGDSLPGAVPAVVERDSMPNRPDAYLFCHGCAD